MVGLGCLHNFDVYQRIVIGSSVIYRSASNEFETHSFIRNFYPLFLK